MKNGSKHQRPTVVPMVTPVTPPAKLDETAVDRLVDFVAGRRWKASSCWAQTGGGAYVPPAFRRRLVQRVANRGARRMSGFTPA